MLDVDLNYSDTVEAIRLFVPKNISAVSFPTCDSKYEGSR